MLTRKHMCRVGPPGNKDGGGKCWSLMLLANPSCLCSEPSGQGAGSRAVPGLVLQVPPCSTLREKGARRGGLTCQSSHHWHRGSRQPVGPGSASFPRPRPLPTPLSTSAQPFQMDARLAQGAGYAERAEGGGPRSPRRCSHSVLSAFCKS